MELTEPYKTEVLPAHTLELLEAAVTKAARVLRHGDIVALPTETVYGLAANAFDPNAVSAIFQAKGRPSNNPIIVHVADLEMARKCVSDWPLLAQRLADTFWPGPLTLVLRRSALIPDVVTAGGDTVGIRWPAHPIMQAVIRACGFPLAAPSANLSNRVSPTKASHVLKHLSGRIPLIIDGGSCQVGIESTVLDLSHPAPRLLRPGIITAAALRPYTGALDAADEPSPTHLKSPGLLPKHYSPRARLVLWQWSDEAGLLAQVASAGVSPTRAAVVAHTNIPGQGVIGRVSIVPRDPEAYARALYAELHACDEWGAETIILEQPPSTPEWQAILDRLRRAKS